MTRYDKANLKGDRVLELLEKGLDPSQIGARLGCPAKNVHGLAFDARRRRAQRLDKQEPAE